MSYKRSERRSRNACFLIIVWKADQCPPVRVYEIKHEGVRFALAQSVDAGGGSNGLNADNFFYPHTSYAGAADRNLSDIFQQQAKADIHLLQTFRRFGIRELIQLCFGVFLNRAGNIVLTVPEKATNTPKSV